MPHRPTIAITLGDPAGVGPEVIDAALRSGQIPEGCEYLVLGEAGEPGHPTADGARSALAALEEAAKLAQEGKVQGVVTGPIHKARMKEVGFPFPGQTEFFADRSHTENFAMCLTGGSLTVVLVTAHVPLRNVAEILTTPEIVRVTRLLDAFLYRRLGKPARLAIAGLNPHAGESGVLGREEIEVIEPALAILRQESEGRIAGPISPDTVFHRAVHGEFDGVVCMYHDQGLIPLKLHAFDEGVNVTLGLPYPRTSPDHGTAFDIAGRGVARPQSAIAAIRLAAELALAR